MPEILIQSKITTPQLHEKIVHRERLTSLLNENKNKNLIIVCAPAGFGKTTLVLDYLSIQKEKHAWFSIPHNGIEDPSTLFEYVIVALRNGNADFGKDTLEVMKQFTRSHQMAKELVYACTASFVNEFQKCFTDYITLVIDDLHYIQSEKSEKWLVEFFTELLENIPSNLHLILSSRVIPEIYLTQFKARRNVLFIHENELTFNEAETASLLEEVYKYRYDEKDLKLLDENIGGWITGLHLLLQAYGEDFNKVKYSSQIDMESIFDFFAQEIFGSLSAEQQELMMVTSLMESFDEDLCNAVLGINNSKKLLIELIHRNLFIHEIRTVGKSNTSSYGYHALFRDFLNRRLRTSRIEHEIRNLMEKIGDSYLKLDDKISAINYFLDAGKFEKAADFIIDGFHFLYDSGKYDVLWKWFNSMPADTIDENAWLSYYSAYLYMYTDTNFEKSLHHINRAIEIFTLNNDETGLIFSCDLKARLLYETGKTLEAIKILESLLCRSLNPGNAIRIYQQLTCIYSETKRFKEAEEALGKALKLCDDHNIGEKGKDELNEAFYFMYYYTAEYDKALIYLTKMLESETILYNIIMYNCNIATVYNDISDYSNSLKYYKKVYKLMESSYSRELLVHVSGQKALLLQRMGDFEESTKILEDVYPHAEKNNAIIYLWHYTDYLFMNYYLSGDQMNCLKYLKLNISFANIFGDEYLKKITQMHEAIYLMKYEPDSSGVEKLIESYNFLDSIGDRYKYSALPWLAAHYLIVNKPESALKSMITFLKESPLGANDLIDSRDLIDFTLSRPELTQYKNKVHAAFEEFFDRLNIEGTSDEYKRKMRVEIENLFDVNMKSFGTLEFVTRGVPVLGSKWRKKKGKSILAYMMVNPGAKYSKDKIIDLFFYDSKTETIDDNYKQAIFNIRNVFKNPYLSFIIAEGKTLYLNPDCYFKSDAEEFNKYCSIARSAERSCEEKIKACKEAIELYKGEFMEGNYELWCEDLRGDFHNKFISISELLLDALVQMKNYEDVILYSEMLLKHDKLNEKAYMSLVEAFMKSEKPKSARETYSKMLKNFNEELAEKPDSKVLNKLKSLLEN